MDKNRHKILFVCEHNSARSQMAEAFLKHLAPDRFDAQSAGLTAGALNALAVESMRELGIEISGNRTKSIDDILSKGEKFDFIITVCDPAALSCPFFPGENVIHWSVEDPSKVTGTEKEKLNKVRRIRDEIRRRIEDLIQIST